MKNSLLLIIILFSTSLSSAFAAEDLRSFLGKIEQASSKVETLSLDFVQEKEMALFTKPLRFTGHLYLRRPDALRWEFYTPLPSAFLLAGDQGVRCENGEEERFSLRNDPIMQVVAEQLWSWVGGNYQKLASEYELRLTKDRVLVVTFPKEKPIANYLQEVRLQFTQDYLPLTVEIFEMSGDSTHITFRQSSLPLTPTIFTNCELNE